MLYALLELFILKGPGSLKRLFSRDQKNQIHIVEKALWWPRVVWRTKDETESRKAGEALTEGSRGEVQKAPAQAVAAGRGNGGLGMTSQNAMQREPGSGDAMPCLF